ncbi:acetyl-CoA transferase [Nakamurella sp. YIM 132087]|uniref:Acetyl-CoA transferase n=1 Tax=Nakamurella alba TaxID=2665158 RepID=A0A7K1FNN1_9ACTN|nr:acetyl-CoA hydrolase/transferase C-terminal domain-containing protein [Nakamurella alba]MTD14833.1 acetyl-CoA transferase [Nakamurella alba]
MSAPDWVQLLRPTDLVVVAQGTGEPTPLLEQLLEHGPEGAEVFVGLSHSTALLRPTRTTLLSFGALGPLGRPPLRGRVGVIPAHFDDLARVLPCRGRDLVLLVQVGPADAAGTHGLGLAVDHTYELRDRARLVIAEVNDQLPDTTAPRLPATGFAAAVPTSRVLPQIPAGLPGEVQQRIANHVAGLVPDGATLQLGISSVAAAIGAALHGRRDLGVRSTLAGDWLLGLARAGALRPGAVTISEAAGSAALYDWVVQAGVDIRPVPDILAPAAAGTVDDFVAVNSALQVDLTGQVNAEQTPAGHVGAIGGQAEYLRAAQRCPGGRSVIALPSVTSGGASRIVGRLHPGTVTTARSSVDFVVTEHGVADLRGRTVSERAALIVAVAAPGHRAALREGTAA